MLSQLKRVRLETEDHLRYSPFFRGLLCKYIRWRAPSANGDQQVLAASIDRLCAAARYASDEHTVLSIERQILDRLPLLDPKKVDWSSFGKNLDTKDLPRSILLKPYLGPREKGVLYVSFEQEWFKLLLYADMKEFSDRYSLVVAPSHDPHNLLNYAFAAFYPDRIFTQISNASDADVLPRISAKFAIVPLYASSWVLPELFQTKPLAQRDVDLIMVANFGKYKRHLALFAALQRMSPKRRVLLCGQDQGARTPETLRLEAAYYGVADRIAIQSNSTYPQVTAAMCRARAGVILSRREGSCVAVVESMFAGAPIGLLRTAMVGSRAFVNQKTGVFLDDDLLAEQLETLIENAGSFSARQYAEENLSCHHSSRKLNEVLRQHTLAAGQEWTLDIAPMCWRQDPALVNAADAQRMQADRDFLKEKYGIEVGPWE
jgi:glycosyltransferase involved in cell wall biosynthesis